MSAFVHDGETRPSPSSHPVLTYTVFVNILFLSLFWIPLFFSWLGEPPAFLESILIGVAFPFVLIWLFFGVFLFRTPFFFLGMTLLLLVGSIFGFGLAGLQRRRVQSWLVVILAGYLLLPFLGQVRIDEFVTPTAGNQLVWVNEPSNPVMSMLRRYMSWAEYKGCEYELLGWEGEVLYYSAETCGIDGKNGTFSYSKTAGLREASILPAFRTTVIGSKQGQVDERPLKSHLEFQGIIFVGGYVKSEDETLMAIEMYQPFSVHDIVIIDTK